MSAIACIYNKNKEPVSFEQIGRMMDCFGKYPADDIGIWHNNNIFFGCHAQWITPESIGEKNPLFDGNRDVCIVADAIIDNRKELFSILDIEISLRDKITDTQLILLAYTKWQDETPKYLVGEYAFIIWDNKTKKIFAARDFSGCRNLYYFFNDNHIVFCSTLNPFFKFPFIKKELNEQWLAEFLAISSVIDVVDSSITVYKDIYQIPPAHSLAINGDSMQINRYCYLFPKKEYKFKTNEEWESAFSDIFNRAVKDRLRTNRNVGSFLSGGLDSGAVVGYASRILEKDNKSLHTFSYHPPTNFKDFTSSYYIADERKLVEETINKNRGIKSVFSDFAEKNPLSEVDETLEILEMPYKFFENSFWLKGIFEKASEKNIGLLLSGERGNLTISWGSPLDYYATLLKHFKWFHLNKELKLYSRNINSGRRSLFPIVMKRAFPHKKESLEKIKQLQSEVLINKEFAEKHFVYERLLSHGINEFNMILPNLYEEKNKHFQELFHWNATNTFSSKFSLKHKLWKRDPTNDLRVINFCLSVPESQYVQNGMGRSLIRRVTKDLLPESIRLNQTKRGIQGVDWVFRLKPYWENLIENLEQMEKDNFVFEYINKEVFDKAFSIIKEGPKVEFSNNYNYTFALRSLIIYKFLRKSF